jgi:hypothetical protein
MLGWMNSQPPGIVAGHVLDSSHWSVRLARSDGTPVGTWDIYQGPPLATEVQPGSYQIGVWRTVWVDDVDKGRTITSPMLECQADVTVTSGPTITATITTKGHTCSIAVA